MYEFQTFAYLDVQKTGSSFIIDVLRKYCIEATVQKDKHIGMGDGYDPKKFYFISVRNPLDQYLSLYSYGCESKGQFYLRLKRNGLERLYDSKTWDGFREWLDFVLDPDNVGLLGQDYADEELAEVSKLIGLQSYRVLSLSIPDSKKVLAASKTQHDIRKAYKFKNIAGYTVRHETLRTDLARLVRTTLRHSMSDLQAVLHYIETAAPRNASKRVDSREDRFKIGSDQQRRLDEREWLLHQVFGY